MKKVSLVMTVLLMGLILSGCGQGSKESGTTGTESASTYSTQSHWYYLSGKVVYDPAETDGLVAAAGASVFYDCVLEPGETCIYFPDDRDTITDEDGFFSFEVMGHEDYQVTVSTCRDPDGVKRGTEWRGNWYYRRAFARNVAGPPIVLYSKDRNFRCSVEPAN